MCDGLSLAKALYFAVEQKADVINLSLSGPDSRLLRALLEAALSRGSVVVTAYDTSSRGGGFPASVPGVIAVSDRSFAASPAMFTLRQDATCRRRSREDDGFSSMAAPFRPRMSAASPRLCASSGGHAGLTLVSDRPVGGTIDACATLARAATGCDCSCGGGRLASARFAH